jgi:hypothetical protein
MEWGLAYNRIAARFGVAKPGRFTARVLSMAASEKSDFS